MNCLESIRRVLLCAALSVPPTGCTIAHSKQAIWQPQTTPPSENARFVTEEDSGLAIGGIITITEPDHYAVLLERARKHHRCKKLHFAQLDYYSDFWVLVSFPIARLTMICEPFEDEKP
jgi:hypothetical protein